MAFVHLKEKSMKCGCDLCACIKPLHVPALPVFAFLSIFGDVPNKQNTAPMMKRICDVCQKN